MKTLLIILALSISALAADFDGDGKDDIAVFRPSQGTWYVLTSQAPYTYSAVQWGQNGDIPLSGDVDGDGKDDYVIYRPSAVPTNWFILYSNGNGASGASNGVSFGQPTDIPLLGDFNGNGKSDLRLFRPSTGDWYEYDISNGDFRVTHFGATGDIPVQ